MQQQFRLPDGTIVEALPGGGYREVLPSAPMGGTGIGIDPAKARAEARAEEDQQLQREAADRAERAAERADKTAQRQAAAAEKAANAAAKPTEFQSKSAGFLGRMMQAEADFNSVPADDRGARSVPRQFFHNIAPGIENTLVNSADRQKADQAVENFIAASLRQESGAAISPAEFDRQYNIFFPAPGDSEAVIKQKAEARRQAIDGFRVAAGPLASEIEKAASPTEKTDTTKVDYSPAADTGAPTGDFKNQPDASATKQLDSFIRAGVPYTVANKWVREQGFDPLNIEDYAKAVAFAKANPGYSKPLGSANRKVPLTPSERLLDPIARSAAGSGIAAYANSATAGIPALLAGREGNVALNTMRAAHPDATVTGDVAGAFTGVLGTGALAKGVANLAKANAGVKTALGADMAYGASLGASEMPDSRGLGAVAGAASALAGNMAGRYLVAPVVRGAGRMIGAAAAKPSYIERKLIDGGELLNMTRQNLSDAAAQGLPYSLADASPQLRYVAGSAARINPTVREAAEKILDPRAMGQAERALQGIDTHLAPRVNLADQAAAIKADAQRSSKPLYDRAMAASAPDDPALNDLLRAPIAERGLREAYDIGLNNGVSPAEISIRIGPDGKPILDALPNWRTLQLLKMGVDSQLEKGRGINGKLNLDDPANRAADDWRKRYIARLGDLNPDYAAGNAAYAEKIGGRTALERGAGIPKLTPDQVKAAVAGTPAAHLPQLQRGYATALGDTVEKTRFASNPYDAINGSLAAQARMATVFPEGAPTFQRLAELEKDMMRTRHEVLGGSPTAQRQQADGQFASAAGPMIEMGTSVLTGSSPSAAFGHALGRKVADMARWGIGKQAQRRAEEVGQVLIDPDPANSLQLLDAYAARAREWQDYLEQSRRLGSRIATPLALGVSSRP